jgi:hypothetical protein
VRPDGVQDFRMEHDIDDCGPATRASFYLSNLSAVDNRSLTMGYGRPGPVTHDAVRKLAGLMGLRYR